MPQQIFWLRESASGAWITPFAFSGELPAEFPAELREQIAGLPFDEVHLPYLQRAQTLEDVPPAVDLCDLEDRTIIKPAGAGIDYVNRYQILLALAAAAHGVEEPRFRLTDYGGHVIEGREASAWADPPIERERRFFGVYRMVSRAFQQCMRERLPAAYFTVAGRYMDTETAWPVLLLAASTPFVSRSRSAFTYDVLDLDSVEKFYRSAERGLPRVLAGVEAKLLADGMKELAKSYAPARAERILAFVKRDRNPMLSLLLAEAMLFDEYFRFAHIMHDLCAPGANHRREIRKVSTAAWEFVRALHSRLRRFYNGVPMQQLVMPLFLAVTHALYESKRTVK
jgi:hypothetical protein